ncbi:potassium-dependent mechanosensitive channel [uncultured Gammaproteobacteria bacterium]
MMVRLPNFNGHEKKSVAVVLAVMLLVVGVALGGLPVAKATPAESPSPPPPASAAPEPVEPPKPTLDDGRGGEAAFAHKVATWQETLDHATTRLARGNLSEADYEELRVALTEVFDQARLANGQGAEQVATTRQMIDALGKPPGEGEPPESENVAVERAHLGEALTRFDGRMRQSSLIATRADIVLRTANERRLNQFTETLFRTGPSPFLAKTWDHIPDQLHFTRDRIAIALAKTQKADLAWRSYEIKAVILSLLTTVMGLAAYRWLRPRWGRREAELTPSYRRRVYAALIDAIPAALVPTLVITLVTLIALSALSQILFVTTLKAGIKAVAIGLAFLLVGRGLVSATLAVRHPAWRLLPISDQSARSLAKRTTVVAMVLAVAIAVLAFIDLALVAPELHAVAGFGARVIGAAALFLLLPKRFWQPVPAATEPAEPGVETPMETPMATGSALPSPLVSVNLRLRLLTGIAAAAVVVLSALRFHNLSQYIAQLLLAGVAVLGVLRLLHGVGHELIEVFVTQPTGRLAQFRSTLFHTERGLRTFVYLAKTTLDLLWLATSFVILLPLSGIDWSELRGWGTTFMRGVTIGEITIAPMDILASLFLVSTVMVVTRFIQRKLDEGVLPRLQVDRGVRHSIRTGVGYIGALIAILLGIGALGLNLSNLAMIAGALSVGIGFGLQAVVGNFVAGLILLIERPIKVGDWIVVGDKDGVVKRISVRATEIQTFQRASVIIPNSDLISHAVLNWTHKDKLGRIDIPVSIDHNNDVELVRRLLLACARADARVVREPPPMVVFRKIGAGSLDFELRCFVADVEVYTPVSSDLRFAILHTFRDNGIRMPSEERIVHVPQLDRFVPDHGGPAPAS